MQYTATAFSMPIRRVFAPVWDVHEETEETKHPAQPQIVSAMHHQVHVADRSWPWFYEPIGRLVLAAARRIGLIQNRQHSHLPRLLVLHAAAAPVGGDMVTAWLLAALQMALFVAAAPLLAGWVKRVKCHLQNRAAPSVFQPYRDLAKLLRKHTVVAERASWLFRAAPYIVFGTAILAAACVPLVALKLPTAAIADVIVLVGFLALGRFFLALAGMDIGTAFGGMGSSREMMIGALAEPVMLMAVFTLSMTANTTNLSEAVGYTLESGVVLRPSFIFAMLGLMMVAVGKPAACRWTTRRRISNSPWCTRP